MGGFFYSRITVCIILYHAFTLVFVVQCVKGLEN